MTWTFRCNKGNKHQAGAHEPRIEKHAQGHGGHRRQGAHQGERDTEFIAVAGRGDQAGEQGEHEFGLANTQHADAEGDPALRQQILGSVGFTAVVVANGATGGRF